MTPAGIERSGDAGSLHTLPLDTLPITHPVLRRSRMVKNSRFESVIELYRDKKTGSGQHYVDTVATMLGLSHHDGHDVGLLRNVALLPTFDIFSVRLLMRDIGLPVAANESLPPDITEAIGVQMRKFTIPLLRYVYDGADHGSTDLAQLVLLFRDPDVEQAGTHLKRLAAKLKIPVLGVPRFLEDYSDTFLAISLYQYTFLHIKPSVVQFLEQVHGLRAHFQRSQLVLQTLDRVHADFSRIMRSTAKRLNASEQLVNLLWGEAYDAALDALQPRLREFQFLLGYLLCGISVKIAAWTTAFPGQDGPPNKCVEVITTEITYALAQLRTAAETGLARRKSIATTASTQTLQAFLRSFSPH